MEIKKGEANEAFDVRNPPDPIPPVLYLYTAYNRRMVTWDGFTRDTVTWARVDRGWPSQDRPENFDLEAFRQTYPIVEEVFDAMCREGREKKYPLYACLDDFKGDTLAFYNNVFADSVRFGDKFYQRYRPWKYDEAAGAPICPDRQFDPTRSYH